MKKQKIYTMKKQFISHNSSLKRKMWRKIWKKNNTRDNNEIDYLKRYSKNIAKEKI